MPEVKNERKVTKENPLAIKSKKFLSELGEEIEKYKKNMEWLMSSPETAFSEKERNAKALQYVRDIRYVIQNNEPLFQTND